MEAYSGTSIWVESLGRNFEEAFDLLEAAIRDCTDELWQVSMWEVPVENVREVRGADGNLISDPAAIRSLVPLLQRHSTPWGVAWHALERLDFVLTGGFVPWEIWPPVAERFANGTAAALPPAPGVAGHTGLDLTTMAQPWSQADLLGYSSYCRGRTAETLTGLTDEKAATRVGRGTYAWRLIRMALHLVEHASQIRQFITQRGAPQASDQGP